MNPENLAERIVRRLDEGLNDLPPRVVYRLRLARDAALARQGAGDTGMFAVPAPSRPRPLLNARVLVPLFGLVLGISAAIYWEQQATSPVELAELDAQVLSDELPVTAYLDQGFEVWLSSHHSTE
ncbi:MAG: DUF3619 domain-containing protein [Proteobacteria bacterium]|nr:MAG: DUF3619 domain-containing protein [Pseudomonadota bacterium]